MPRKARIIVPGAIHHIMSRGNEGKKIFLIDDDRNFFLNTCRTATSEIGISSLCQVFNGQSLPFITAG